MYRQSIQFQVVDFDEAPNVLLQLSHFHFCLYETQGSGSRGSCGEVELGTKGRLPAEKRSQGFATFVY